MWGSSRVGDFGGSKTHESVQLARYEASMARSGPSPDDPEFQPNRREKDQASQGKLSALAGDACASYFFPPF